MHRHSGVWMVLVASWFVMSAADGGGASDVVVGVNPTALVGSVLGSDVRVGLATVVGSEVRDVPPRVGRTGLQYGLMRDGKAIGGITIGVFPDTKVASEVLQDSLTYTAVGPTEDLSPRQGQRWIVFAGPRIMTVVLQRQNSVVSLWLWDTDVRPFAKQVDSALAQGLSGVERGAEVVAPRILEVDHPERVPLGGRGQIRVRVALPEGANGDRLGFADRMGVESSVAPQPTDAPHELELIRTFDYRAPREATGTGPKEFWVCYATAKCVTVSRKIGIEVVPE